MYGYLPLIVILAVVLISSIKVLNEYERGVMLTFGRFTGVKGPGVIIVIPMVQEIFRISTRVVFLMLSL